MSSQTSTEFPTGTILAARNITLSYAEQKEQRIVLQNVSLQLNHGEIIALLGPSGAGKSSLLRVLAGLQKPRRGQIHLRDRQLHGPDPALGFVFQDPCLLPWLTLEQNVAFGLDFKRQPRIDADDRKARTQNAICDVGLLDARNHYPDELSGGMAQRTSLARALARLPQILLLDEPFSALDEVTRQEMQKLLLRLTAKYKTSAILVTHDIGEALAVADRIILIGGSPGHEIGQWSNPGLAMAQQPVGEISSPGLPQRKDSADHRSRLRQEIVQALTMAGSCRPPLAVAA